MTDIDPLSLDFALRHPDSFARVLGRGDYEECEEIVASLPPARRAAIVARLPAPRIQRLLESKRARPAEWLVDAPFDDAVTLLSRIPRERRLALVNSLDDPRRQRQLLRHQQYPAHSIGALVSDIPLRLGAESLAADVVDELRELDGEAQGPVVVVDTEGRYLGILDHWKMMLRHPPTGRVKDYLVTVKALRPEAPATTVALDQVWDTRNWLPVTDHRQRVVGVVSRQKVLQVSRLYSGAGPRGGDVLLDLLADLVHVGEALLLGAFARKDAP